MTRSKQQDYSLTIRFHHEQRKRERRLVLRSRRKRGQRHRRNSVSRARIGPHAEPRDEEVVVEVVY